MWRDRNYPKMDFQFAINVTQLTLVRDKVDTRDNLDASAQNQMKCIRLA